MSNDDGKSERIGGRVSGGPFIGSVAPGGGPRTNSKFMKHLAILIVSRWFFVLFGRFLRIIISFFLWLTICFQTRRSVEGAAIRSGGRSHSTTDQSKAKWNFKFWVSTKNLKFEWISNELLKFGWYFTEKLSTLKIFFNPAVTAFTSSWPRIGSPARDCGMPGGPGGGAWVKIKKIETKN